MSGQATLFGFPVASPGASVALFVVGLLLSAGLARLYLSVRTRRRRMERAWHDVEAALTQRADRLAEFVRTLVTHPTAGPLIQPLYDAYVRAGEAGTRAERIEAEQEVSRLLAALVSEADGLDGEAHSDFADLRIEMRAREQYVTQARERYNEAAEAANADRASFPAALFARALAADAAPVFAGRDE